MSSLSFIFSNFTVNFQCTLQQRVEQSSSANFSPCFGISATPNLHFYIIESCSFASFKAVGAPRRELSVFPNVIYVKFSTSWTIKYVAVFSCKMPQGMNVTKMSVWGRSVSQRVNGACRNTDFVSLRAPARHLMMHIKLFAICQLPRNLSFEASKTPLSFITDFSGFFFRNT